MYMPQAYHDPFSLPFDSIGEQCYNPERRILFAGTFIGVHVQDESRLTVVTFVDLRLSVGAWIRRKG